MIGPTRRTRRDLLAAAGVTGAAAIAGCGALDGLLGEDLTVDGGDLVDAVSGEGPGVRETVPVDIERSFVAGHHDRAESLLSSVPVPLDETDVPNGAIREAITDRHDEALEALDTVAMDERDAETIDEFVRTRGRARTAAASWAAVDDALTPAAVRDEMSTVRSEIDAVRERWRYVGDDPVAAVVTYGVMEDWLEDAPRDLTTPDGSSDALWLGEFAGNVERARTGVENLDYLFDRHLETLSEERSLRERFLDATDQLTETVARRERDLPADALADARALIEEDAVATPAESALAHLARSIDPADHGRYNRFELVATDVLGAHRTLTQIGAFEWLHERIEGGEHVTPSGIEDVRGLRRSAIEAIRAADNGPTPHLTRQVLSGRAGIEYVDRTLREDGEAADDGVSLEPYELRGYVRARAMAKAVTDASETVATALRSE